MAINLRYDHRVSPEREADFDSFVDRPRSKDAMRRAIVDYFRDRVRTRQYPPPPGDEPPDFLDKKLNGNNFVTGITLLLADDKINEDVLLVRVVDLSGLRRVLDFAANANPTEFGVFSDLLVGPPDGFPSLVDGYLSGLSTGQRMDFARLVLKTMNYHRNQAEPHQPCWVTTWNAFKPFYTQGPERWLEVSGIPRLEPGRWLLLLRYTVREAGLLVRPTQLDAGWSAHHFPSPPQAPLSWGGHPMDLQETPPAEKLLPEYIHMQIDYDDKPKGHLLDFRRTARSVVGNLATQRRNHLELLRRSYHIPADDWMLDTI